MHIYEYVSKLTYICIYIVPVPSQSNYWVISDIYILSFYYKKLVHIIFLCTRVVSPVQGDKEKLKRVLSYINGTKNMIRIIGTNYLNFLQVWIDASYAMYRDTRGHMGGEISMGKGVVIHNCGRQKSNT